MWKISLSFVRREKLGSVGSLLARIIRHRHQKHIFPYEHLFKVFHSLIVIGMIKCSVTSVSLHEDVKVEENQYGGLDNFTNFNYITHK